MHSDVAHQDYLISVALPFHHGEEPGTVWPVIYVPDANLYFPVSGTLAEMLHQVMHLRLRDSVRDRNESFEQFI